MWCRPARADRLVGGEWVQHRARLRGAQPLAVDSDQQIPQ